MQVAQALNIEPRNVHVKVTARFRREGSIIGGTAFTACDGIKTELTLDCDEPPDRIAHLIRMSESICFAMTTLRNPIDAELDVTVNGQRFEV